MARPPLIFRASTDSSAPADATRPVAASPSAEVPPLPAAPLEGAPPYPANSPVASVDRVLDIDLAGPGRSPATGASGSGAGDSDGLDAFESEQELSYKTHPPPPRRRPGTAVLAVAGLLVAVLLVGTYLALTWAGRPAAAQPPLAAVATGQAQFDSRPVGADVVIDGTVRGKTPLKLSLPVGVYALEIRGDAGSRTLPLSIEAGVLVSQYVELLATPDVGTGQLDIKSDPPGAEVSVDGVAKGVTPLTLDRIDARNHVVSLTRGANTVYRTVAVKAGVTASLVVAMGAGAPAPGAVGGFLTFALPFEAQVFDGGRLVGTTRSERLMVPTGRRELELVNSALQFAATVTVSVEPGRVTSPAITIPEGALSVNALPWAEVFIDGRGVGTTPLANLTVPIGTHEIVWRHPQLGERRQSVTVTAQSPARAGVNFSQ